MGYLVLPTYPGIITEVKAVSTNAYPPMAVTPLTWNIESHMARYDIDIEMPSKDIISTHSEMMADFSEAHSAKALSPMDCTVLDDIESQPYHHNETAAQQIRTKRSWI